MKPNYLVVPAFLVMFAVWVVGMVYYKSHPSYPVPTAVHSIRESEICEIVERHVTYPNPQGSVQLAILKIGARFEGIPAKLLDNVPIGVRFVQVNWVEDTGDIRTIVPLLSTQ